MKQQSGIIISFLTLALVASILAGIHFYRKTAELEQRLLMYLPAAQALEMENIQLKQHIEYLEMRANTTVKDTTNRKYYQSMFGDTFVTPATPPIEYQLPQGNAPTNPGQSDFRDLNPKKN